MPSWKLWIVPAESLHMHVRTSLDIPFQGPSDNTGIDPLRRPAKSACYSFP